MLEKILSIFEKEPVELESLDNAPEKYREAEQSSIQSAKEGAEGLQENSEEALDELETFLEDLQGYEDEMNRSIVEDVVDNVADDRLKLVREQELSHDPYELKQQLDEIILEFNDIKEKEKAVLDEANLGKELSRAVSDLEKVRDRVETFLETDYSKLETAEELDDLVEEKQEQELELEDTRDELERVEEELEVVKEELEDVKQDIDDLTSSPQWRDYREMEEDLELLEERKEEKEREFAKAASKMERGMKKLVYQFENQDLEFTGDISVLKQIRDGETDELLSRETGDITDALEEATGTLPMDLLKDSVHQKFMDGAQYLMELENWHSDLCRLRKDIEDKREKLDNHPSLEEKEELEKEVEEYEKKLEKMRSEKRRLKKELRDRKAKLEETTRELKQTLREGLGREVGFETGNSSPEIED